MSDPPPTSEGDAEVAGKQPWMGLAAYSEGDTQLFCGRDREIEGLDRLVHREPLTVVFGPSGTGKSSLLNAGLFPRWRAEHLLPIYIRVDYSGNTTPGRQIRERVAEAIADAGIEAVPLNEPLGDGDESAWEYLHRFEFWDPRNNPVTPVLVFDQFEEVFTLGRDLPETETFIDELADLVENYVPADIHRRLDEENAKLPRGYSEQHYKIILTLREDFVSRLDSLNKAIPSVMLNRFSLTRMNGRQALEVVLIPGRGIVDEPVAREIVEFVSASKTDETAEEPAANEEDDDNEDEEDDDSEFEALSVEPALLSLVCRELNTRRLSAGQPTITSRQLEESSGDILVDFYERSYEGTDGTGRIFVEDRLVTASGFRSTVPAEDAYEAGLSEEDVAALIDRRLMRKEDRLGIPHLELTHDVLTGVVQQSRDHRRERERLEEERLERAERARKTRKLVLTLSAVAAVFLCFGLVSLYLWREAERQKKAAIEQLRINLAQNLFLNSEKLTQNGNNDLSVLLLAAAHHDHGLDLESNEIETAYRNALTSHLLDTMVRRDSVTAVAWSPREDRVAFTSNEGSVEIWSWDPQSGGKEIQKKDHAGASAVAWSGDGQRLAIGDLKGQLQIWNPESDETQDPPVAGEFPVSSIAWDPSGDGRRLAWGALDGTSFIWNVESGASAKLVNNDPAPVNAVVWNADGSRLAAGDDSGVIRIWNGNDGTEVEAFKAHDDEVRCLSWRGGADDEPLLASGAKDGEIRIWDLEEEFAVPAGRGGPVVGFTGHSDAVNSVEWGGTSLASAGADGKIRIWVPDPETAGTWAEEAVLKGHGSEPPGGVGDLAWNFDGRYLASCGTDGTIRIWDAKNRIGPDLVHQYDENLSLVVWSPDGARLAFGGVNGGIWVRPWDGPGDSEAAWQISEETSKIRALAWEPSGDRLAIARNDGTIRIRDSRNGEELGELTEHESAVLAMVWNRDGSGLASADDDGQIRIWETGDWGQSVEQPFPPGDGAPIRALIWESDGRLLWGDDDGNIRIWNGVDQEIEELTNHEGEDSYAIAWNRAGTNNLMAIAEWEDLRIWDVDLRETLEKLTREAHKREVTSVAWTPGGRRLASASSDKSVRVWEPMNQNHPVHILEGHKEAVWDVAWDGSGLHLASASNDKSVRVWNFDGESWLQRARRLVNRNLTEEEWTNYIGGLYDYRKLFEDLPGPETPGP